MAKDKKILRDDPYTGNDGDETRMTLTPLTDVGMPDQHRPLVRLAMQKKRAGTGWSVGYASPWFRGYSFVYITIPMDQCSARDGFPDEVRTLLAGIPHECYFKYDSLLGTVPRLGLCIRLK